MNIEKSWQYNEQTLILVKFDTESVSFSHEFGVENQTRVFVSDLTIFIFNFGLEADVTKSIKENEKKLYDGLIRAAEEHFADAIGDMSCELESKCTPSDYD